MYQLPYFTETDKRKIHEFMESNSFATITGTNDNGFPVATHIPLRIKYDDGKFVFSGHLMKKTDHHIAFINNPKVLVIFHGPHSYISASWYVKKDVASTWNYMAVHASGEISFTDDAGTLAELKSITGKYEERGSPASFECLPEAYVNRLMQAVVGFTITANSLDATFKLSQNHDDVTRMQIIESLEKRNAGDDLKVAEEMKKTIS